jgi:hypothetical protein
MKSGRKTSFPRDGCRSVRNRLCGLEDHLKETTARANTKSLLSGLDAPLDQVRQAR